MPAVVALKDEFEIWKAGDDATAALRRGECPARIVVTPGPAPVDVALLERLPNLGLIAAMASGYEGVDPAWARAG